jgi:multidrug transporter EmrE-like cation transporter
MSARLIGILFVLCSVVLESIAQLCLKKSTTQNNGVNLKQYWTLAGVGLFAAEAFVWTLALHQIDVSMAYPMGSLSFVAIALLSQLWLKERVTKQRWLGVGLIISGTTLVGLY